MQCDAYHGEYVSIGDHISQASCEGAEGTWTAEKNDFHGTLDDQSIISYLIFVTFFTQPLFEA